MPRLYSVVEDHNFDQEGVDFINGAAAVASGADVSYFDGKGYAKDATTHALTVWDKLPMEQLRAVATECGVADVGTKDKKTLVLAVEAKIATIPA